MNNIEVFKYAKKLENLPQVQTLFYKYFIDRLHLIEASKHAYLSKDYLYCTPILLLVIDGIVNDIVKVGGFFSDEVNLIIENSIVGSGIGLQKVKEIVSKGRSITNNREITIPYRNGILHGRDLNYGNQIVAAKCWSILFALLDWAKDNNVFKFSMEEKATITQKDLTEEVSKNPREVVKSIFEYLIDGNKYHKLIYYDKTSTKLNTNTSRMGDIRRYLEAENLQVLEYSIVDEFEARENIIVFSVQIKSNNQSHIFIKKVNFHLEYLNMNNELVSLNDIGSWKTDFSLILSGLYLDVEKMNL